MVMEAHVIELGAIVSSFSKKMSQISTEELAAKPNPEKWSKKEVLGHLTDSAQNNLRRFVVGQYEETPHIVYDQDFWVTANGYQQMKAEEVIALWKLQNERIMTVLSQMPKENYGRECNTGKSEKSLHSLEWLAADYIKHMKHHLNQIIPGSFNITYP
jgi:hypothetical protein